MMIVGNGIDLVDLARFERALERHPRFLMRNFTENERVYFDARRGRLQSIAGHFALKEAASKALGTGFRGFNLIDIEIYHDAIGKPEVQFHGGAKNRAEEIGAEKAHCTISHHGAYLVAHCILEGGIK